MPAAVKPVRVGGERYEATVPDTLDLAERAAIAINGLGGTIDPEHGHDQYFYVRYRAQPPYMSHMAFDHDCTPKFAESFPFMRLMSGADQHIETEQALMSSLVSKISPDDGLYYAIYGPDRPWHSMGHRGYANVHEDYANVAGNGRMLRAMVAWRERDGDPAWDDRIRAMARGLERIAIHKDNYAYYPDGGFAAAFSYPRSGWLRTDEPQTEVESGEGSVVAYHGHQLLGLSWWYQISGDEYALAFATKLANFIMLPKFWGADETALLPMAREQGHFNTHFHARTIAVRGLLQYAIATDNLRIKEFVRHSYEHARTQGVPRIGWFACTQWAEGCNLGDMVAIAVQLSDAGLGDYWDDVDRIARNLLVEQQLVRADLLTKVSQSGPVRPAGSAWHLNNRGYELSPVYPGQETTERVIERSLGTFASQATLTSLPETFSGQCCTGNGTQGLYYAWEGIVRHQAGAAQVNLLLNRASPWLDIDSYLPYEGKVILRNKTASRISVRIPSWVNRRALRCQVDDVDRRPYWAGNYLLVDGLVSGNVVTIEFPMMEETVSFTAMARHWTKPQTYAGKFKGNTLVDISPRDDSPGSYPIFLRDHYKQDKAPMKKVTRYVAPAALRW